MVTVDRLRVAQALHAERCHWCRLGSPMCSGAPAPADLARAAEFEAVLGVLARAS